MKFSFSWLCLLLPIFGFAQLPVTNIYLFDYRQVNDSIIRFSNPKFLTDFNKNGYNNQPNFFSGNELYLTVQKPSENQTEIFKLDLHKKKKYRVTKTSEPEYSPTPMPNSDYFSVIRVENDNRQRLWELPQNRSSEGIPLFPNEDKIGYHLWLNEKEVALFLVGDENSLSIANLQTGQILRLVNGIGRCFQKTASGNLAYIFKATKDTWLIQEFNPQTKKTKRLINTLPQSEDFTILTDGTILAAYKSTVYKFHPAFDTGWLPIADFSFFGIKNITRMAINKHNKIALVAD